MPKPNRKHKRWQAVAEAQAGELPETRQALKSETALVPLRH